MCTDCILFLDDLNPNKIPSSNGRKFYISSPPMREFEDNIRARDRLKKLMKGLVIGDSKPRYYLSFYYSILIIFHKYHSCYSNFFLILSSKRKLMFIQNDSYYLQVLDKNYIEVCTYIKLVL